VVLAAGAVTRGEVVVGHDSAILENCVVVGPSRIGRRTVFGHRCLVVQASVGDLCEVGNATILLPGSSLGDGCLTGEGTLIPAGVAIPPGSVVVGRPGRIVRRATEEDRARVAALREGQVDLREDEGAPLAASAGRGGAVGTLTDYRGRWPEVDPSAVLWDSAEVHGDVTIGPGSQLAAGVKVVGDSHGPVRIGARVQLLEGTVLHLLPDGLLLLEDDVVVGPGCVIHGCHLGRGTVVEPGAIVADHAVLGEGCLVTAGSVVKQRTEAPPRSVLEGFPARVVGTLDAPPPRPSWALDPEG
jgi:carbonic anhydrase/acetyltransferase-like protein (isoleucine patch superfamily)